jgi:hypothetical protein
MATSWLAHSAAASFEDESIARFTTSANSTRSTSVVNRRPPSTFRNAVSTSRAFHSPCSSHAAPTGREAINRSPSAAVSAPAVPPTTRRRRWVAVRSGGAARRRRRGAAYGVDKPTGSAAIAASGEI